MPLNSEPSPFFIKFINNKIRDYDCLDEEIIAGVIRGIAT
jgi:hypothetical protein